MTPIERKGASWKAALTAQLQRVLGWIRRGVAPPPQCAPAAPDNGWPGSPRILVVDDDPSGLERARELLGRWGIAPMVAADGVQAVEFARRHEFDLILMDLQMPVLDGLGATKQIRLHEQARAGVRAPVLAYTSNALEDNLLRDCGVDGVLEKPCSAEAIYDCLLRWCGPSRHAVAEAGGATEAIAGAHSQR